MGHEHADSVFDLEGRGIDQGTIGADGGDGSVNDVVDLVGLEGEDLAESASDFVLKGHCLKGSGSIDPGIHVCSSHNDGVEIVVSKLTGLSLGIVGISEDGSIGVPLSDGGAISHDGFLDGDDLVAAEDLGVFELGVLGEGELEGFIAEHVGSVGLEGKG